MAAPVTICDVGPRDGLQNEAETLAPEVRAELVNRLSASGLQSIEAVSFVRAESVPQMAGAEEVVAGIERQEGVAYSGLVLNEKGYERLAAAGLDAVHFTLGATDEFNRRNANRTVDESVAELERIETELPGERLDQRLVRLSLRGRRSTRDGDRARRALRRGRSGRDRLRGHDRRRCAPAGARLGGAGQGAWCASGRAPAQHA